MSTRRKTSGTRPRAVPDLGRLVDLVARLRGPGGCPWDQEQRLPDCRAYLLEEAHEVAGAIDREDWEGLADELGDLLFQVVFIVSLAQEGGRFDLHRVIDGVHAKMVARHPHVFGNEPAADAKAVRQAWERRKLESGSHASLLEGLEPSLPALLAAYRMTQKAAGVGFDWPDVASVVEKLEEEMGELRRALAEPAGAPTRTKIQEEIGDLLLTVVNLARKLEVDPEAALAQANLKFKRRFQEVERALRAEGKSPAEATVDEMDGWWERIKRGE